MKEKLKNMRGGRASSTPRTSSHDERLGVVAELDAEGLKHGTEQVPVVQPGHGGATSLERVYGRGGHAPQRPEIGQQRPESLLTNLGGGRREREGEVMMVYEVSGFVMDGARARGV